MDDLLSVYGANTSNLEKSQEVEGTITEITPKAVYVDIGRKSEGVVAEKAFQQARSYIKDLKVGQKVKAAVLVPETRDGYTILSFRKSYQKHAWKALEEAEKANKPIKVVAKATSPSGIIVEIDGTTGFVPSSHIGRKLQKNLNDIVGKGFQALVIDLDQEAKRVVLSEKFVSEKEAQKKLAKAFTKVEKGKVYKGRVTTITDFGCFVELEEPSTKDAKVEGLVHISEISWEKVKHPSEVINVGEEVNVYVIDKEDPTANSLGKLYLSIKQASKDPWDTAIDKYKPEQKVNGKVVKRSEYGMFVELEPGIEGLLHVTKIPPGENLQVGDEREFLIEEVDEREKRISLGLVLTSAPVGYK